MPSNWYSFLFEPDTDPPRFSIGRLLLCLIVLTLIVFWILGFACDKDLPDSLFAVFTVISGYVFGGKVVSAFGSKDDQTE